ncbi:MAG: 7-cyano-7-deazaguanine synthase QueC [Candidatus Omnitrophota bacterium]
MAKKEPSSINKKGIILLSGGVDSAVCLYIARSRGFSLTALIFDYGQRHKKEIGFARKIASINKINYHIVSFAMPWTRSSLTQEKIGVGLDRDLKKKEIPLTYVSARNTIFLSFAFSLSEAIGAKSIFIGAHTQDYSGYPDCRREFLMSFKKAANLGLSKKGIDIKAPLINKSKKEIIRTGLSLGVPFQYTWSCYQGGKFACGRCDSCRFRINAFNELGLRDPVLSK